MTDAVREPTSPTGQPRDELGLSPAALAVLAAGYLRRDAEGRVVESTGEMIGRVASHVAAAEDACRRGSSDRWAQAFSGMMRAREFLPDSPTLLNAGGPLGLLAGGFVSPVADSLRSIFATLRPGALRPGRGGRPPPAQGTAALDPPQGDDLPHRRHHPGHRAAVRRRLRPPGLRPGGGR